MSLALDVLRYIFALDFITRVGKRTAKVRAMGVLYYYAEDERDLSARVRYEVQKRVDEHPLNVERQWVENEETATVSEHDAAPLGLYIIETRLDESAPKRVELGYRRREPTERVSPTAGRILRRAIPVPESAYARGYHAAWISPNRAVIFKDGEPYRFTDSEGRFVRATSYLRRLLREAVSGQ